MRTGDGEIWSVPGRLRCKPVGCNTVGGFQSKCFKVSLALHVVVI